jgi:histidyl-tRNA synthetase
MVWVALMGRQSVKAWSSVRFARRSGIETTQISGRWTVTRLASATGGGRISNAVQDKDLLSKSSDDPLSVDTATVSASRPPLEKLNTNPPKGTRDFYPEDMRLRTWLFDQWRAVAKLYGFVEYDAPVLESESLYIRKAGEEVTEQLYNFVDKGNRTVALRPEMTPSLARMVLAKSGGLPLPLKWFAIPQCWRYERMTRGRRREHYQWNMDIWGVAGAEAEAELLAAMVHFFQRVGITSDDVGIKVNSRMVIGEVLTELGIPAEKFAATCVLVDKLEKVPIDSIQGDLEELGLDRAVVERLLVVLTNKSIQSLADTLGENSVAVRQLTQFMTLCEAYDIQDWILFDASVVRGLAYYTGIVFEAFDRKGELRAIAGGGRYDKLLETFGGEPTPAVGFGFGDAVIVELLKERNVLPSFVDSGTDTVVFAMPKDLYAAAIQTATALRFAGQSVDVVLEDKKPKWVFKHADRIGARYCVIVGADEYSNGEVAIKNLKVGTQETVRINALAEWVLQQEP